MTPAPLPSDTVFFLRHLDTYVTTLILAAMEARRPVEVQVPEKTDHPWFDHDISVNEVFKPRSMRLHPHSPHPSARFVVQLNHSTPWNEGLLSSALAAARMSGRSILLYDARFGSYLSMLKAQIRLLARHPVLPRCFDQISYYSGWAPVDLFSIFACRRRTAIIGPNISVSDPANRHALVQSWDPEAKRSGKISFFGTLSPERLALLRSIENELRGTLTLSIRDSIDPSLAAGGTIPWLAGRGLDWAQYPAAMTYWDLTLCLPGAYPWAHRTIEALFRGSIPVLASSELPYFRGLLRPGITCFPVDKANDPGAWAGAMRTALSLSDSELVRRRRIIWNDIQPARTDLGGTLLRSIGI